MEEEKRRSSIEWHWALFDDLEHSKVQLSHIYITSSWIPPTLLGELSGKGKRKNQQGRGREKKERKGKKEILTKIPVPKDELVHLVAGGLVLGGESQLLQGGVLLKSFHKLPLWLSRNGGPLVGNPQLLQGGVLVQNVGKGLKTGTTNAEI